MKCQCKTAYNRREEGSPTLQDNGNEKKYRARAELPTQNILALTIETYSYSQVVKGRQKIMENFEA